MRCEAVWRPTGKQDYIMRGKGAYVQTLRCGDLANNGIHSNFPISDGQD